MGQVRMQARVSEGPRSRWPFSAPGLPHFPHPGHATKRSNRAGGREMPF